MSLKYRYPTELIPTLSKVKVYRNLHQQCYSIIALEGEYAGKVVAHATELTLMGVDSVVSETGRQRVIKEQKKNVHAFLIGTFLSDDGEESKGSYEISYNPYSLPYFFKKEERIFKRKYHGSNFCYLQPNRILCK